MASCEIVLIGVATTTRLSSECVHDVKLAATTSRRRCAQPHQAHMHAWLALTVTNDGKVDILGHVKPLIYFTGCSTGEVSANLSNSRSCMRLRCEKQAIELQRSEMEDRQNGRGSEVASQSVSAFLIDTEPSPLYELL